MNIKTTPEELAAIQNRADTLKGFGLNPENSDRFFRLATKNEYIVAFENVMKELCPGMNVSLPIETINKLLVHGIKLQESVGVVYDIYPRQGAHLVNGKYNPEDIMVGVFVLPGDTVQIARNELEIEPLAQIPEKTNPVAEYAKKAAHQVTNAANSVREKIASANQRRQEARDALLAEEAAKNTAILDRADMLKSRGFLPTRYNTFTAENKLRIQSLLPHLILGIPSFRPGENAILSNAMMKTLAEQNNSPISNEVTVYDVGPRQNANPVALDALSGLPASDIYNAAYRSQDVVVNVTDTAGSRFEVTAADLRKEIVLSKNAVLLKGSIARITEAVSKHIKRPAKAIGTSIRKRLEAGRKNRESALSTDLTALSHESPEVIAERVVELKAQGLESPRYDSYVSAQANKSLCGPRVMMGSPSFVPGEKATLNNALMEKMSQQNPAPVSSEVTIYDIAPHESAIPRAIGNTPPHGFSSMFAGYAHFHTLAITFYDSKDVVANVVDTAGNKFEVRAASLIAMNKERNVAAPVPAGR